MTQELEAEWQEVRVVRPAAGNAAALRLTGSSFEAKPSGSPGLVLSEVDCFLRMERKALRKLIAEMFDPRTRYEYELPLPADIARAFELDAKFSDLGLGLVDGVVAATAERRQVYRILTTDRRDFAAVRVGPRFSRPLALLP